MLTPLLIRKWGVRRVLQSGAGSSFVGGREPMVGLTFHERTTFQKIVP